jgi:hypothetical protein
MTRWISLVCLLAALTPGYAQDLLKRVKADYLAKDKQYDRLPDLWQQRRVACRLSVLKTCLTQPTR